MVKASPKNFSSPYCLYMLEIEGPSESIQFQELPETFELFFSGAKGSSLKDEMFHLHLEQWFSICGSQSLEAQMALSQGLHIIYIRY